jgi:hypothetical protein
MAPISGGHCDSRINCGLSWTFQTCCLADHGVYRLRRDDTSRPEASRGILPLVKGKPGSPPVLIGPAKDPAPGACWSWQIYWRLDQNEITCSAQVQIRMRLWTGSQPVSLLFAVKTINQPDQYQHNHPQGRGSLFGPAKRKACRITAMKYYDRHLNWLYPTMWNFYPPGCAVPGFLTCQCHIPETTTGKIPQVGALRSGKGKLGSEQA